MPRPKHNYDSPDFYGLIEQLAKSGYTDKELASELRLSHETFSRMKNGKCPYWAKDENTERGKRITEALAHGRIGITALLRAVYFRAAFGGRMLKSTSKDYAQSVDKDGNPIGDKVLIGTVERLREQPPNLKALHHLLMHYDAEWRRIERGKEQSPEETEASRWIEANTTITYQQS